MELRHLRYFLAVAEEHNFTRAAERLGIKQPPLSLQIRRLEKELGTPLFRRLTRGVELTGAGKLFLEQARTILQRVDQAKIDVKRRARGETGRISLGASGACYFHPLVGVIVSQFVKLYPDIVLCPEEDYTRTVVAGLHAGKFDAALIRFGTPDLNSVGLATDGLAVEPIVEEDTLAVVQTGGAFGQSDAIAIASLAKEKFILLPPSVSVGFNETITAACRRAGFHLAHGQVAPGLVAIIPMVAAGYGVSIVPQSLSRLGLKGVTYLPITGHRPVMPINLAYRRNDQSPAVRNLVALVRRSIPAAA